MSSLLVYRAKPNPLGKDKYRNQPIPFQLQAEWIDLINTGSHTVTLSNQVVSHMTFADRCVPRTSVVYWEGNQELRLCPNQILRVHTGKYSDSGTMLPEDYHGAHLHVWANSGSFHLNNNCGDSLGLWLKHPQWVQLDKVNYDPYPPEGAWLVRRGDKLVVA